MTLTNALKHIIKGEQAQIDYRTQNIDFVFIKTIYSKTIVEQKYDECYNRLKAKAKSHDESEIHRRTIRLTLKSLID